MGCSGISPEKSGKVGEMRLEISRRVVREVGNCLARGRECCGEEGR